MNKKTITIVIIVVAVLVVIGLAYSGFNHWRQQRLANQILKQAYGLNTGILGGLSGNNANLQEQIAKELAKEEAKSEADQKAEEAKEAAKTPEDRYNETEEMPTYDANSKAVVGEAQKIVEAVFGKAKPTSVSTGMLGQDLTGSGLVEFKIARLATGNDLGTLNKVLTEKGFPVLQSGIDDKTAGVSAGSDAMSYTFSFEIGEQNISVIVMKTEN